jgi:hypothetical protein
MDKKFKVVGEGKSWKVIMDGEKIVVDLPSIIYENTEVMAILDAYKKAFVERLEEEKRVARKFILDGNVEFRPKG